MLKFLDFIRYHLLVHLHKHIEHIKTTHTVDYNLIVRLCTFYFHKHLFNL